jgi:hypothetical protein
VFGSIDPVAGREQQLAAALQGEGEVVIGGGDG